MDLLLQLNNGLIITTEPWTYYYNWTMDLLLQLNNGLIITTEP